MPKRTERLIAIGAVAGVVLVPSVLVMLPIDVPNPLAAPGQDPVGDQIPMAQRTPAKSPTPKPSTSGGAGPQQVGGRPVATPSEPALKELKGDRGSGKEGDEAGTRTGPYRTAETGAKVVKVQKTATRQYDVSVQSPALGSTQKVRMLVPPSWRAGAQRTWPVVYVFHGGNDSYVSWTRSTDIASLAARYDVIVAMPEGSNGSYTDWYNDGKGGIPKWETFHTTEVRQLLERNFHAGSQRAAMGISSGAQGAMTYTGRHPGMFKYTAAYSGVLSMLSPGIPSLLMYVNSAREPKKIWGDPALHRSNWVAHDPTSLLAKMRGTRLHVSAGNGKPGPFDPPGKAPWDIRYLSETQVWRTTQDFVARAKELGVPVTADMYGEGSHTWPYWKREMHKTWPSMMRAIGAAPVK
ncbi:alpha/beta hydrolase [Actinomadura hibisca]|uniref:alpha/beta hydrolase n=1 Tax=Actinomadura hibisca TaxID=68565 RepID=UPI0009FF4442|nr:alpha/beta hydrolase family protein [Actinomadura hibisca]